MKGFGVLQWFVSKASLKLSFKAFSEGSTRLLVRVSGPRVFWASTLKGFKGSGFRGFGPLVNPDRSLKDPCRSLVSTFETMGP